MNTTLDPITDIISQVLKRSLRKFPANERAKELRTKHILEKKLLKGRHQAEIRALNEQHRTERGCIKEIRVEEKLEKKALKVNLDKKKLERIAVLERRRDLRTELKILQDKKKMLNRECHQQTSNLFNYEANEKNKIRAEFNFLKRHNALKIRGIHMQLNPSKKMKPIPKYHKSKRQKARKWKKDEVRKLIQKCIDDGQIPASTGVFDLCNSFQ